jgi:protein-tyrosine phosphatase
MYTYNSATVQAYIYVIRRNPPLEEEMKKVQNNKEKNPESKKYME